MKAKTAKKVIRAKVQDWLESIEDKELRAYIAQNVVVTGGCIVSMLLGEPVNDFDIYLRTKDAAKRLAQYYVSRFQPQSAAGIPLNIYVNETDTGRIEVRVQSAGVASEEGTSIPYDYFEGSARAEDAGDYLDGVIDDAGEIEDTREELKHATHTDTGKKYRPVFLTTNAISLSHKVQIVLRFYGEPEDIHKNYDFVHCTNYWKSWDDELVLHKEALESILTRELKYKGSLYPVCSLFRMRKFIKRGWSINAGQILKAVLQTNALDLTNGEVLKDQLTGVDSAYFVQMLNLAKQDNPEKFDCAYLIELIDRVF